MFIDGVDASEVVKEQSEPTKKEKVEAKPPAAKAKSPAWKGKDARKEVASTDDENEDDFGIDNSSSTSATESEVIAVAPTVSPEPAKEVPASAPTANPTAPEPEVTAQTGVASDTAAEIASVSNGDTMAVYNSRGLQENEDDSFDLDE